MYTLYNGRYARYTAVFYTADYTAVRGFALGAEGVNAFRLVVTRPREA